MKKAHPDAALLVAGPTDFFGQTRPTPLTDQIEELGGRWLGPVPEDEVADVFRSLDICAMPTRQDEMFGMAAAEALSSGTPVVCSNLGGLPEVVPSSAGVLVQPGDAEALAEELIALCRRPRRTGEVGCGRTGRGKQVRGPAIADRAEKLYREARRDDRRGVVRVTRPWTVVTRPLRDTTLRTALRAALGLVGTFVGRVANVGALLLAARHLGSEQFGGMSLALSTTLVVTSVSALGLPVAAQKLVAEAREIDVVRRDRLIDITLGMTASVGLLAHDRRRPEQRVGCGRDTGPA